MTTIVTRAGKGSPLTNVEVDANFTNLNNDKLEKASNLSDLANTATARSNLGLGNVNNTSDANKPISTATQAALDLKADAASPTTTGTFTHSGDIVLSGAGKRITGDFSNATVANRVMFKTSTVNGASVLGVLPNGTGTTTGLVLGNNSDPTNWGFLALNGTATDVRLTSGISGTGTYLPMTFYTGGLERMRIDTNGNVGIGTNSPLSVAGYTTVTTYNATNGALFRALSPDYSSDVRIQATNGTGLAGTFSNVPLLLYTNSVERMRIDASGNVGIGTSSPGNDKLNVYGNINGNVVLRVQNPNTGSSANTLLSLTSDSGTLDVFATSAAGGDAGVIRTDANFSGGLYLDTFAAAPIVFRTNGANERMRIDSSGNVGIGTSSPSSRLDLSGGVLTTRGGSIRANNSGSSATLELTGGNSFTGGSGAGIAIRGYTAGYNNGGMEFYYANGSSTTEGMRLDASGNLLLNTTTSNNVGTGAYGDAAQILKPGANSPAFCAANSWAGGVLYVGKSVGGSGQQFIEFFQQGNTRGTITNTGTGVTYNTSSDYRLKENIQPMQNALDVVAQLNPVTYTWKADGSEGQGFIAHELQAVVPDCVTGEKDAVDKDGNPIYQGIDTSFLVATLTAAIQEQQAIITQLQSDVAALKGQA